MNGKQRFVLILGAILVAAMVVYPPYQYVIDNRVYGTGYGPIFDLPKLEGKLPARVNATTLGAQLFGVLAICGLLCLAFKDRAGRT